MAFVASIWRTLAGLAAGLLLTSCAVAQETSPPVGLWQWSRDVAPDRVRLEISRGNDAAWTATVNGEVQTVMRSANDLTIDVGAGQRFVGHLNGDRSKIVGFWHQESEPLHYQSMATPVALAKSDGTEQWAADIVVQRRSYRLFLDIFAADDGSFKAAFRNPEGNNILRSYTFEVEQDLLGGWDLVRRRGDDEQRHDLVLTGAGQLGLYYPRLGQELAFAPVDPSAEMGYYPRHPDASDHTYRVPQDIGDGWKVATPEEAGFDRAALDALVNEVASTDPRSGPPKLLHSILVAHKGRLVLEEYFYGHSREDRHDVRSLGKVFGSVLVGALQLQGKPIGPADRTVERVLSEAGVTPTSEVTNAITLGDLMTYTSGLDCAADDSSAGSEERMWTQDQEPNYWRFTARLEQLHPPGIRYAYCSGSANLVGAALVAFGKEPVHALFDRLIARPLGFEPYHFALSPDGQGYLGGGMYMRPRDVLKVGALFTGGGEWNGAQIIRPDWIFRSTLGRFPITPETTGLSREQFENNYIGGKQAYIWREDAVTSGETSYRIVEASGNGGQLLIIVPELDLAVVFTGGNYRDGRVWNRWRDEFLGKHIIPAMQ